MTWWRAALVRYHERAIERLTAEGYPTGERLIDAVAAAYPARQGLWRPTPTLVVERLGDGWLHVRTAARSVAVRIGPEEERRWEA